MLPHGIARDLQLPRQFVDGEAGLVAQKQDQQLLLAFAEGFDPVVSPPVAAAILGVSTVAVMREVQLVQF